eukprot:11453794-Karenia_brevis.AAC.1
MCVRDGDGTKLLGWNGGYGDALKREGREGGSDVWASEEVMVVEKGGGKGVLRDGGKNLGSSHMSDDLFDDGRAERLKDRSA